MRRSNKCGLLQHKQTTRRWCLREAGTASTGLLWASATAQSPLDGQAAAKRGAQVHHCTLCRCGCKVDASCVWGGRCTLRANLDNAGDGWVGPAANHGGPPPTQGPPPLINLFSTQGPYPSCIRAHTHFHWGLREFQVYVLATYALLREEKTAKGPRPRPAVTPHHNTQNESCHLHKTDRAAKCALVLSMNEPTHKVMLGLWSCLAAHPHAHAPTTFTSRCTLRRNGAHTAVLGSPSNSLYHNPGQYGICSRARRKDEVSYS